ncbi:hypothetical protein DMUE_3686 [Dictyocoela muelleri]|nr:hypothetical protein DMUE_3686 [Dictyocoela muelleri]
MLTHVDGNKNKEVDSLSRFFVIPNKRTRHDELLLELNCKALDEINGCMNDKHKNKFETFKECIKKLHDNLIHPGAVKLKMTLQNYIRFPEMNKFINEICLKCHVCNTSKDMNSKYGITTNDLLVSKPNECVALEIKGPIKSCHFNPQLKGKYFYLLVMNDLLSRYTETGIINNIKTETIIKEFNNKWTFLHGSPSNCQTDNGRQFISEKFEKLLKVNGIGNIKSSPHNTTGNGIVERINRDIGNVLRISRKQTLNHLSKNIWKRINLNAN